MSYGQYAELVQEVLDFVESGRVLRDPTPIADQTIRVVRDFDEATRHAWSQDTNGDVTWVDLREREKGQVLAARYRLHGFDAVDEAVGKLLDPFAAGIRRSLKGEYADLVDDVVADLHSCALSRAVSGTGNRFFERLFAAYRAGGWPCGWSGAYPEGALLVFQPALKV